MITEANGSTHVGMVRSINQDSYYSDPENHVFIVADGMGGHAGGEIASQMCTRLVADYLEAHIDENIDQFSKIFSSAINHASTKIFERALEEPNLKGMGTTATALKIVGNKGYYGHVGDSRLYIVRCGFIYQVTHDHSLVSEQVRAGVITEEEAERHHLRNIITRSVGYQEEEFVDAGKFILEDLDLILLCSDGLHGKVSDEEISKLVTAKKLEAVEPLIQLANDRGGEDNITVIISEVRI